MFKSGEEKREDKKIQMEQRIEEETVTLLDELALKIVDGDATVKQLQKKPGVPQMTAEGCVVMDGPKTLEVTYYE